MKKVIISIPFWRIAKLILSKHFIDSFVNDKCEIIFITPLDIEPIINDINSKSHSIKVIKWEAGFTNKFIGFLFNISEILRLNGYWFRNRKKNGFEYYCYNMFRDFNEAGTNKKKPLLSRIFIFVFSALGSSSKSWKILNTLIRGSYIYPSELSELLNSSDDVSFIQSASWGIHDRLLASWAEENKIPSFFIPYTTDQLLMNGYLLTNYEKLFIQGELENQYLLDLHNIEPNKIEKSGSLWLRNIDALKKEIDSNAFEELPPFKIVYAGVLSLYYPRHKEIEIVLDLIEELELALDKNWVFVYRPYLANENEKKKIEKTFDGIDRVSLQWPSLSINSLENVNASDFKGEIIEDIRSLTDIDVFIMSVSTSLAIDAAYISGAQIISNLIDFENFLADRKTFEGLVYNNTLRYLPGTILAESENEIKSWILARYNECRSEASKSSTQILSHWDYENLEFPHCVSKCLFPNTKQIEIET